MANSVAEAVIGAAVRATAAGFVLYAGQSRGLGVAGDTTVLHASFRSAEGIPLGTDVRLAGTGVVAGRGEWDDGRPVAGARVFAGEPKPGKPTRHTVVAGTAGTFRL